MICTAQVKPSALSHVLSQGRAELTLAFRRKPQVWITCAKLVEAATPAVEYLRRVVRISAPWDFHPDQSRCVVSPSPANAHTVDQELLDKLASMRCRSRKACRRNCEYGWCGGRHVLDNRFDFEHNVFNDRIVVCPALDTNRVPAD